MAESNSFGETICDLRKRQNLTQEQIAEGLCSPIMVSRIENGHQMPSRALLDAPLSRLHSSMYQLCNVYYQSEQDRDFEDRAKRVSILLNRGRLDECPAQLERLGEAVHERPTIARSTSPCLLRSC